MSTRQGDVSPRKAYMEVGESPWSRWATNDRTARVLLQMQTTQRVTCFPRMVQSYVLVTPSVPG